MSLHSASARGTYGDSCAPRAETDHVRLTHRLARLDERVIPASWRQRPTSEAARAKGEIKIGVFGLVTTGILAVATGHWELLGVGGVFLIVGLVRLHANRSSGK